MPKPSINFTHALIAVVAGNVAYFLISPHLPYGARHVPFRLDLGIAVDFWFCLVAFGIVKTIARALRSSPERPES